MEEMYQSVGDAYDHHLILKGVAENKLVKCIASSKMITVHCQNMSLFWKIMPATQRNEEVRTQVSRIYKRTTHILKDIREEERSIHQQTEKERYTRSGEGRETNKSGHQRKCATKLHTPPGEHQGRVKSRQ